MSEITAVSFKILSAAEAKKISVLQCTERKIYDESGAVSNGLRDPLLGPTARGSSALCKTCGETVENCAGHFGHVDFVVPLFHINRMTAVVKELRSRCRRCCKKECDEDCAGTDKPKVSWTKNMLMVDGKQTCANEVKEWLGDADNLLLHTLLVPPNAVRPPPTIV